MQCRRVIALPLQQARDQGTIEVIRLRLGRSNDTSDVAILYGICIAFRYDCKMPRADRVESLDLFNMTRLSKVNVLTSRGQCASFAALCSTDRR